MGLTLYYKYSNVMCVDHWVLLLSGAVRPLCWGLSYVTCTCCSWGRSKVYFFSFDIKGRPSERSFFLVGRFVCWEIFDHRYAKERGNDAIEHEWVEFVRCCECPSPTSVATGVVSYVVVLIITAMMGSYDRYKWFWHGTPIDVVFLYRTPGMLSLSFYLIFG